MYLLLIKAKLSPYFREIKDKLEIPDTKKSTVDTTQYQVASKAQCQQQEDEEDQPSEVA